MIVKQNGANKGIEKVKLIDVQNAFFFHDLEKTVVNLRVSKKGASKNNIHIEPISKLKQIKFI